MKLTIFSLFILLIFLFSCTDSCKEPYVREPNEQFLKAKRQLEIQGYKNVRECNEFSAYFCCGNEDSLLGSGGFCATAPDGSRVVGCYCAKRMGGPITLRFD